MATKEPVMLFRDPEDSISDESLGKAMSPQLFSVYQELISIMKDLYPIQHEWRYYRDGKAWLCKAIHKKKTVFWMSVWDRYIQITFYFTEKTASGLHTLPVDPEILTNQQSTTPVGKLIPVTLKIHHSKQLKDFSTILGYKVSLK
ncbi:MAG TPA: DUF3788 family protein [Bacteroidales bacterium]|nr:DUF3788 family protein [Bacteroidales bacterium]